MSIRSQSTNSTATAPVFASDSPANEFLTFRLGSEEYGIDILKVQEIRRYDSITHIANSPDYIKGVINLRGTIVPIIDMRIKFNLDHANFDQFTVVIILTVANRVMGILVDGVSDVVTLSNDQIRQTPGLGSAIETEYLLGLGTVEERMLILIDIVKLMSNSTIGLIDQKFN